MNTSPPPGPSRPARKSGVIIPHQPPWHGRVGARTLWLLASVLAKSWRLRVHDETRFLESNEGPAIFAVWHNRLAITMALWQWGRPRLSVQRLAALISASRDGGFLAQTFQNFGVRPIRGSSSRRGPQALIELARALRQGYNVAITPDGPRGPKYVVQSGIISLAQVSGVPILPVGGSIHRKIELQSWDRFQVPLPLANCDIVFGRPLSVPREATAEKREQIRLALQNELIRISPDPDSPAR